MARERTTDDSLVLFGVNVVLELLRSGARVERVLLGPGPRHDELIAAVQQRRVPFTVSDRTTLNRVAGTAEHQGVVAVAPGFDYASLDDLLEGSAACLLVLDGVQDPRNLGAILRTARAAGVDGVILPRDRAARVTPVVVSAAAGSLFGLPIARVTNVAQTLERLRRHEFWTVGLAPGAPRDLYQLDIPRRLGLVVGGEGEGMRPLVRRHCDFVVSIPMAPGVESLNVAVATGVALYEIRRARGLRTP